MNSIVRDGLKSRSISTRITSVSDATPLASSSAPGARVVDAVPLIESRCAPSTTVSAALVPLPAMRSSTDFCGQPVWRTCSTRTCARVPASARHCCASQSDASTPLGEV